MADILERKVTETGAIETTAYDAQEDKLYVKTDYDPTKVAIENLEWQKNAPELGQRYKGMMTKVCSILMEDIVRLKREGYDLMSPDQDERRRALCHIQQNEKHLMTVPGKPFSRQRKVWA